MYNHQLDVFRSVADHGSISAAARASFVSQPSITRQIASLERRLGAPLFERTPHGMELTEAGRVLYNRSGQIIELCNETAETIRTLHASRNSQVRIATGVMIYEFLYEIIERFVAQHPDESVTFRAASDTSSLSMVEKGEADICVACDGRTLRATSLGFMPLFDDSECCLVCASSPLATRSSISPEDLIGHVLLIPPQGYSDSNDLTRRYVEDHGIELFSPGTAVNESAIVQTVASDPRIVDVLLVHHMRQYPGVVTVPFDSFGKAKVGFAYQPCAGGAVAHFLEAAASRYKA